VMMARSLHKQHLPLAEIQRQVDKNYSHIYPFVYNPTPAYKEYQRTKLWTSQQDVKTEIPTAFSIASILQTGSAQSATRSALRDCNALATSNQNGSCCSHGCCHTVEPRIQVP
jgi:hypothetical protein